LRKRESPVLPGEEREKEEEGREGWHLLVGGFYSTLNLGLGRHYIITWFLSPVG
jgi:hypothetical protein